MNRKFLQAFFVFILVSMLIATGWASSLENVFVGGGKLMREPWGIATLADTYFGFLTFYIWVFYKERTASARIAWFVLIVCLGNIAMATFALLKIYEVKSGRIEDILLRVPTKSGEPL